MPTPQYPDLGDPRRPSPTGPPGRSGARSGPPRVRGPLARVLGFRLSSRAPHPSEPLGAAPRARTRSSTHPRARRCSLLRLRPDRPALRDRGAGFVETAAVTLLVAAVMVAVYQLELSSTFNEGVRQMVCLVEGPECGEETWVDADRPEAPEAYEWGRGNPNALDNQNLARNMAENRGWTEGEWQCLSNLWSAVSQWDHTLTNPDDGAIGISGFVPGRHGSMPQGFRGSPSVQISWGLGYIADTYGTPCAAWSYWQGGHFY
ncbi:hypothetical protein [Nocardiopsis algeriensis]|uniref:Uncharacterized protein n=1 Tax=Nocardiopsis algeriensis TaxID=1478215 RepID=A0A841IPQ6_9ACTN|nr:hypothetical protein [Nocardiopsis algeriensis]MBB6120653.1 hypothetical protein [Nocardiopsis algeriensis]